ncbi:MAG: bifunctional riboflavin kinase/FMN adenylyltransferase, partial [Moraxellaceae bacterium]|nr:bifunctional riboflavin kinase/FMN adenylyltransferase [Moraxellaceae bacterium]
EFVHLLINKLNVKAVVIGDDFRFGHDRAGDSEFLRQSGLEVTVINTVTDKDDLHSRISSTRIRELLQNGDLTKANELLGRDYCMLGEVQHGDKIGRTLNFPTANIALNRLKPALHGVFAVDVQILDKNNNNKVIKNAWKNLVIDGNNGISGLAKDSLFGTANIGTRPAVNGQEWRLEVHFPQFTGDLYGKLLKVRFLHFLHGERHYDGLEALKEGINNDVGELLAWREKQVVKL